MLIGISQLLGADYRLPYLVFVIVVVILCKQFIVMPCRLHLSRQGLWALIKLNTDTALQDYRCLKLTVKHLPHLNFAIFLCRNLLHFNLADFQLILLSSLFPVAFGVSAKFCYGNSYRIIVYITYYQEYCISYHGCVDILCR